MFQRCLIALSILLLTCFAEAQSNKPKAEREWASYGHDPGGMRYSALDQINRSNVARLKRIWTYHTGEVQAASTGRHKLEPFECTPLVVDGVMYLSTPWNRVIALEAETGAEIWRFDPQPKHGGPRVLKGQHRGVSYWSASRNGQTYRRIFFGTYDGRLISLDATTGKRSANFGRRGVVNLRHGVADRWPKSHYAVTSPPAVYKNLIITGASVPEGPSKGPSGSVRAFDAWTGELVWQFDTVPQQGQFGNDTWERGAWQERTGVNVWSIMSVDPENGLVYLPIGSPAYDFYAADRKGQNLFGNSLVALDAATGRRIWHFQLVHHDIWDYDLPAQPTLVTVRRDGRSIQAVAQVTKMGLVFVFDRLTGKPLFPIHESDTPASDVPGEATWPTQPIPQFPPALSRSTFTEDDLTSVTPESRKECSDLFAKYKTQGRYTPWGLKPTLVFPGTLGGATWSGASFDPTNGLLYVNVNEVGAIGQLTPHKRDGYRRTSDWGEYARFWDQNQYPCQQPPWATLNAVDLNEGELAWRVTLGVNETLSAQGVPQTGALNLGGSIVTAGKLVFIAGTSDSRFRAFDSETGKELWVTRLEASGHATPMTFLGRKTGKQFVVIAAGGGGSFSRQTSDVLAAYALPEEVQVADSTRERTSGSLD